MPASVISRAIVLLFSNPLRTYPQAHAVNPADNRETPRRAMHAQRRLGSLAWAERPMDGSEGTKPFLLALLGFGVFGFCFATFDFSQFCFALGLDPTDEVVGHFGGRIAGTAYGSKP